jgi:hypothetical protein
VDNNLIRDQKGKRISDNWKWTRSYHQYSSIILKKLVSITWAEFRWLKIGYTVGSGENCNKL